jgi:cytochrome P450
MWRRAILHDEAVYPDPHAFKPERWLKSDGQLDPDAKDPLAFFGFGRRLCPGRYLAMGAIFVICTLRRRADNVQIRCGSHLHRS